MNEREEQRVIEALGALTGGLIVTEHDMLIANNRLKDNLEPPSPRRRLVMVAVVAAAAVVAGLVIFQATDDDDSSSPTPVDTTETPAKILTAALGDDAYQVLPRDLRDGTPPTADELAGVWLLRPWGSAHLPLMVTETGSYRVGVNEGSAWATSTLSGATWIRETGGLGWGPGCPSTQTFTTALAGNGALHTEVAREDNTCTFTDGLEVWDPVGPGSAIADYWQAMTNEAEWQDTASGVSGGLYVSPETGQVLEVSANGRSYRYYDSSADNRVDDSGSIEAEPGAISASCSGGEFSGTFEAASIPGVGELLDRTTAIRITADAGNCGSSLTANRVWVLLPDRV